MGRNKSHLSPMSHLKVGAKEEEKEEEEAKEGDKDFNKRMTIDRIAKVEDNPSEEDGNPEEKVEEEEEDHLTKAQISENLEWPAKHQIKTDASIAMNQDISLESAHC